MANFIKKFNYFVVLLGIVLCFAVAKFHLSVYNEFKCKREVFYEQSNLIGPSAPICKCKSRVITGKKLGIVPILRAGLGMVDGFVNLIPTCKVGHIGLYRDPETHTPVEYYCKLPPDVEEREIIVVDPMLATGGSSSDAITMLKARGCKNIRLVCLVGVPEGIGKVQQDHPDVDIYIAAIDEKLNENKYIVPGLGDAGDRIFGTK